MFGLPSGSEWLLVLLLVLIVFGGFRLPEAGRRLGAAIEDMRDVAAPQHRVPESAWEGDIIILAALAMVAVACVAVLALSESGWV